jgi:hypothetical protein
LARASAFVWIRPFDNSACSVQNAIVTPPIT